MSTAAVEMPQVDKERLVLLQKVDDGLEEIKRLQAVQAKLETQQKAVTRRAEEAEGDAKVLKNRLELIEKQRDRLQLSRDIWRNAAQALMALEQARTLDMGAPGGFFNQGKWVP